MTRYGLFGELTFWIQNDQSYGGEDEDTLFAAFGGTDEISVELSLLAVRADDEADNNVSQTDPVPFVVKGLVSEREVYEQAYRGTNKPATLARRYSVSFLD